MTENELYSKLVDLYAADELSEELTDELHTAALTNPELSHDMLSLKTTVQALRSSPEEPEFTEESFQRILMKLYTQGVELKIASPEPTYIQYRLPMPG